MVAIRTFEHRYTDRSDTVLFEGAIPLSVREIEDAALLEIIQSPGAKVGHWSFLSTLLEPGTNFFQFREPLGQSREVKTAFSGLFGRFVARAYATRYLGISHYLHVTKPPMRLSGAFSGRVLRRRSGDMPDWIGWGRSAGMAIVEAKGSHHRYEPHSVLERAYLQAERAEIRTGRTLAAFKRYAIVSRWGHATTAPTEPLIWVKDPDEMGEARPEEMKGLISGLVRQHAANLLQSLGHEKLSSELRMLALQRTEVVDRALVAMKELDDAPKFKVKGDAVQPSDDLIGGFVTRAGRLDGAELSRADKQTLEKLGLAPTFVGVSREQLSKIITGEVDGVLYPQDTPNPFGEAPAQVGREGYEGTFDDKPRDDGAGSWVIRLDRDGEDVERVS